MYISICTYLYLDKYIHIYQDINIYLCVQVFGGVPLRDYVGAVLQNLHGKMSEAYSEVIGGLEKSS